MPVFHRRVITCVCLSVSDENANLGTAMRYEEIGEWGLQCVDLSGLVCRVSGFPSCCVCLFVCLDPVNMMFTESVSLSSCLFAVCRVAHLAPVWQ